MNIGARIYWDKATGNVILNTGHKSGPVVETTVEQDFQAQAQLKDRVPETVGMIQLDYGQYVQDFSECNGLRVDPATEQLQFSYPDPGAPQTPPVYQKALTEQLAEVKAENAELRQQMAQQNADFTSFQDFYFENNPGQA